MIDAQVQHEFLVSNALYRSECFPTYTEVDFLFAIAIIAASSS